MLNKRYLIKRYRSNKTSLSRWVYLFYQCNWNQILLWYKVYNARQKCVSQVCEEFIRSSKMVTWFSVSFSFYKMLYLFFNDTISVFLDLCMPYHAHAQTFLLRLISYAEHLILVLCKLSFKSQQPRLVKRKTLCHQLSSCGEITHR